MLDGKQTDWCVFSLTPSYAPSLSVLCAPVDYTQHVLWKTKYPRMRPRRERASRAPPLSTASWTRSCAMLAPGAPSSSKIAGDDLSYVACCEAPHHSSLCCPGVFSWDRGALLYPPFPQSRRDGGGGERRAMREGVTQSSSTICVSSL